MSFRLTSLYLFVLACGLYLITLSFGFVYDDSLQILLNSQITNPDASLLSLFSEPTPPGNLFRPIPTATFLLTAKLFGVTPVYFHAVNVLLYGLIAVLVHKLFSHIFNEQFLSLLATALFVVHPLHIEVVANIVGRAELLACLAVLVSCLIGRQVLISQDVIHRAGYLVLIVAVAFLGNLSKESSLTSIIIIPLFAWLTVPTLNRRFATVSLLLIALSISGLVSLLLRHLALQDNFILSADNTVWPENPVFNLTFGERVLPAIYILGKYITAHLAPFWLSADYSCMPIQFFNEMFSWQGVLSIVAVLGMLLFTFLNRKSTASFFGIWFVCTFLLTINLIVPIGTIMADRLAFLPSIGGCGLIALSISSFSKRISVPITISSLFVVGIFTVTTVSRIGIWRSNTTLFEATVLDTPNSPKAHYNLGVERVLKDPTSHEAEADFRKALEIHPDYILPTRALADIMLARRDYGRLEYWYTRLLALTPEDQLVAENLEKLRKAKGALESSK